MHRMTPPLLADFLDYLQTIRGSSESTRKEYGYDLSHMLRFLLARKQNINADENPEALNKCTERFHRTITLRDLHAFLAYLDREKQNAASSRTRKISAMRTYFSYLTDTIQILDKNPADGLESPRLQKRYPVYLTLDESKRLLTQINQTKNDFLRTRDYAMTLLFLTCGLRLSELAQIDIDAIKVDSLNVIGKGNKERTIFLTNSVLEAIRDCEKHRPETEDPALFLSTHKQRMTNRAIQYRIDKHLAEAGFDTKLYSTHKLRHTAATLLYKHGKVDIRTLQELLGHESIATTQIYTHTDDEQLREAIAKNPLADLS